MESEPGVTPIVSGLPYSLRARRAPPASVGIFIDGVEVPLLYHAFFGPSVIHPGLFERVDLYKGAAPASYGRYAGAIIATETRAPRYELNGEASLRIIDAGALIEAPFADGRGSALVAGRYSYTGLVLSLISNTKLQYWDYQTLDAYRLSPSSTLSVFAFGAFDLFESGDTSLDGQIGGQTQFHRFDVRYDWAPDDKTQLRAAVTFGFAIARVMKMAAVRCVTNQRACGSTRITNLAGQWGSMQAGTRASTHFTWRLPRSVPTTPI